MLTVHKVFEHYIEHHASRKGQDVNRLRGTARHFETFFLDRAVTTLKRADFRAYEDSRLAKGVKGTTVRKELTMFQAAMNHCVKWELLPACPKIEKPSAEGGKRRPLTEEEFGRLMAQPLSFRAEMFFWLAYWTGARSKAIEHLTWDRVHFDTKTLDYNEPGQRKHNKRRVDGFPIPDELLPKLQAAYDRHLRERPDDPYVITRGSPRRNQVATTYHQCKAALRAIGINENGICRHTLRKTFTTERLKEGHPPALVAALIGDKVDTMMKHYSHLLTEDLRGVANRRKAA